MEDSKQILSVGIDIGTSTSQFVISRLSIENEAPAWVVPMLKINKKEVIYKSPVYFTPMIDEKTLDIAKIREILSKEYETSGFQRSDVQTGAIIITGESANKENADAAAEQLAEFAGDFVVAVAGPDLESILAGHGSGAALLSERRKKTVMNFDVGGGTTNTAVFQDGIVKDAWGIHIGGRLIRIDRDGTILYVSEKLQEFLKEKHLEIYKGQHATFEQLDQICTALAQLLADIAENKELTPGQKSLQIYHEPSFMHAQYFSFSGGVGDCVYRKDAVNTLEKCMEYGDIGPLLGYRIRTVFEREQLALEEPEEKIRATVIGAGSHSMQLSGSTVHFDEGQLPLKNIPVACIRDMNLDNLTENMQKAAQTFDGIVAFSMKGFRAPTYAMVKKMAAQIWKYYSRLDDPILVLLEEDMAKVLGQTLRIMVQNERPVISLDGIAAKEGDYIDFCKAVSDSMLVVVKTLIFKN